LFFDFTYLDDNNLILEKASILQEAKNIGLFFTNDVFLSPDKFYYRPLLNLSFMFDAQSGATLPTRYHFSNIIFHLLAVSLAFCLLRRLTKRPELSLGLSLIYLVHPVLTQAVAWIPGRNDVLLAIFVLAAFLKFLDFSERPRLPNYLSYLLFLFLALLTKETAVFLPILIIFYFLFINSGKMERHDKWLIFFGSLATGAIWFLMRTFALDNNPFNYTTALVGSLANLPALHLYLGKLLFPFNLAVFPILADSTLIYGLSTIILLILAIIFSHQKNKHLITFGLLWFLLFLLPAFFRLNSVSDFLEHRVYLPFFGFLIIIAELDWLKNLQFSKRSTQIGGAILLLILGLLTLGHSQSFRSRLDFWQAAATTSPHSPLAQRNLGAMYYLDGDFEKAAQYYRQALVLNENEPMAHNNLGVIYLAQDSLSQAEKEFKKELLLNPDYDYALFNLGDLYYRQQRFTEAAAMWQAALRVNPYYLEPREHLLMLENRLK